MINADVQIVAQPDPSIDARVWISTDALKHTFGVQCVSRAPLRSTIAQLELRRLELAKHTNPLLLAPRIGPTSAKALVDAGWSWADGQGNYDLRAPGLWLRQSGLVEAVESTTPRLPFGRGGRSVIRWLICAYDHDDPITMSALAERFGISQVVVSRYIKRLRQLELVDSSRGLGRVDRKGLLHEFVRQYSGAGGYIEYAYTLDAPVALARRIVEAHRSSVAISADVGPDELAPWRTPTSLIVYCREPIDLEALDLVSAAGPSDANVIIQVPKDLSVFVRPNHPRLTSTTLADPTQMYIDLHRLGGDDRQEAAEKLESWILKSSR